MIEILSDWKKIPFDVLVIPVFKREENSYSLKLQNILVKEKKCILKKAWFKGEKGEILFLPPFKEISFARIYIGLGEKALLTPIKTFEFFGIAGKNIREKEFEKIGVLLHNFFEEEAILLENAFFGIFSGNYQFEKYKGKKKKGIKTLYYLNENKEVSKKIQKLLFYIFLLKNAVYFTRDLINSPGNEITPVRLAEIAKKISEEKNYSIKIFNEKKIKEIGMEAYFGVGQGSKNPPRFIHIIHKPKFAKKKIVLIGKGLTFDSGGLSLKPSKGMVGMKIDKSGACAVLGVFKFLKDAEFPFEVHGIIPACENMPSGSAQRPDDIVRAYNGKTVEIISTDAEGRLTLADALAYASKLNPDIIIDLATLTGACVIALGEFYAGLFTNSEVLKGLLLKAGEETGETLWHLPLDERLIEKLKTHNADIKNSGGKWGGAITAALFLKEFVNEKIEWAHIDIAGPSSVEKSTGAYPEGATGFGVRLIFHFLKNLSSYCE